MPPTPIAHVLQLSRELKGITKAELARRLGVDSGFLGRVESGERGLSLEKVDQWLAICEVRLVPFKLNDSSEDALKKLGTSDFMRVLRFARALHKLAKDEIPPGRLHPADIAVSIVEQAAGDR